MSKMINLLKPEIREGYFQNEGKSEHYKALHIPCEFSDENLKMDIKAGAVQFKPCLEYLEGSMSNFVIIICDSKEEGLAAVTYIRGANDFDSPEEMDGYEFGDWLDYDNNIPVIDMQEILDYENNIRDGNSEQFLFQAQRKRDRSEPYWVNASGDFCILDKCLADDKGNLALINHNTTFANPFSQDVKNEWQSYFSRFLDADSGVVYYILVREHALTKLFDEKVEKNVDEEAEYEGFGLFKQTYDEDFSLCSLILRYTAEVIDLKAKTSQKENYYRSLFKGWVNRYGYSMEKNFPLRRILKNICMMDDCPSETTERILKYIRHKYPESKTLSGELFTNTGVLKNVLENEEKRREGKNNVISMDELVGMEDVKQQFNDIIRTIKFSREREKKGLPVLDYRNVFLLIGAPGTAKTTMANILGRMMKKENLLKGTRFGSFSGAQLKAEFLGQTAHKVHEIFENHDILIIDEAYSLTATDMGGIDTYSQEALAQLAIELENHGTDRLVFFAGYGGGDVSKGNNKMKEFLDANPGIKSRINGTIVFPSYNLDQMLQIVKGIAGRYGYEFEDGALDMLSSYFTKRMKDEKFGNGREARSFVDNCQMTLASRVMQIASGKQTKRMMQVITKADVENTVKRLQEADSNQLGRKVSYGFI